jgi:DNA-binding NtrC family response regulator
VISGRIIIVDDDPVTISIFERILTREGHRVESFAEAGKAAGAVEEAPPDLVITDLKMPGESGLSLLERVRSRVPDLPVIVVTGHSSIESAVEAMKKGAYDYLQKPVDPDDLVFVVRRVLEAVELRDENRVLRAELAQAPPAPRLLGEHAGMKRLFDRIDKAARVMSHVLITGETGTGKEVVAKEIHRRSGRRGPFVPVHCGALAETLLENELFGHEKGAFTGAGEARAGLVEAAQGGTLFLDEVACVSGSLQIKLLRLLQERTFRRVGGTREIKADVRFLAATNRELASLVSKGEFREDLYHRLNVVVIDIPPLRDRRSDIPLLADHFIMRARVSTGKRVNEIPPEVLAVLSAYAWPGNVRELENVIEGVVALMDGDSIGLADLPARLTEPDAGGNNGGGLRPLKEMERAHVLRVLAACHGDRGKAAAILGIDKSTLWRKLKEYEEAGGKD